MTTVTVKPSDDVRRLLTSEAFINPNHRTRKLPMFLCKPAERTQLFWDAAGYPSVPVSKAISCVVAMNHDIAELVAARDHLIELINEAVGEEHEATDD